MELIVKIGADQQGLADTLQRISNQFKTMNTSMPASWSPQMSAMNKYGNIMQSSNANSAFQNFNDSLTKLFPTLGGLVGKLASVAGPVGMLTTAIAGLGGMAAAVGSKISESGSLSRQSRIAGASAGMLKTFGRAAEFAGIDKDSAFMALNRLNAQAGNFNNGDKEAQSLFGELGINPSGQSVDDVLMQVKKQFGGITDPAKRARLSKGLFGRGGFEMSEVFSKMDLARGSNSIEDQSRAIEDIAAVKKNSKKFSNQVGMMFDDLTTMFTATAARSRLAAFLGLNKGARRGSLSQTIGEEIEVEEKDKKTKIKLDSVSGGGKLETLYRWRDGSLNSEREPKDRFKDSKTLPFDLDSMAQVGLFTGSSLAYNSGNNSVAQQQIDLLTGIRDNTARLGEGDFK